MKIIDKTPLLDEKGELGILQRVQGMLQFGFNWPNELKAQKTIIAFFDRKLEKGFTLIRNMSLGESGIMIPMILLGPTGMYVIQVTHLRGRYEARGDAWNVESGNQYKPAPVNVIQRTVRMANALQAYIERQGVKLPVAIESVLIAADPGLQIESVRPAIKVMMVDGIAQFVSALATGRPVMSLETVHDYTDRILNPRKKEPIAPPAPEPEPKAAWEQGWDEQPIPQQNVSRARTIFNASEDAKPFNPNDFDFAMTDDEAPAQADIPAAPREISPALPRPRPSNKIMGMTPFQLAVIGMLALAFVCILAVFAYLVFMNPSLTLS